MNKIGIIGCGIMGSQIALALCSRKMDIIVKIRLGKNEDDYKRLIKSYLNNPLWKRYVGSEFDVIKIDNIVFTSDTKLFNDRELIIETINENIQLKSDILQELNELDNNNLIVATNTSGLLISQLSKHYKFPDNFLGLHFFNPLSAMRLVEITHHNTNKKEVIDKLRSLVLQINKTPIIINNQPGQLVNRLITPFWLDAIRELENSTLTADEIDNAIKLACNHPTGPLEVLDNIGLDIFMDYCKNIFKETKDSRFIVPKLLKTKVFNNELGVKTNRGFYIWENNKKVSE